MINFIDLFAGAGGLSEGFIREGFLPVAHVEMNKDACDTLRTRTAFHWLKEQGNLSWPEMLQIFNCGIGYVLVVADTQVDDVLDRIKALRLNAWEIGTVVQRNSSETERVSIAFD